MKKIKVHKASLKGKRRYNEDTELVKSNDKLQLWSIHDGHGGDFVSIYLKKKLGKYFFGKDVKYPITNSYIKKSLNSLQQKLIEDHPKKAEQQGSTLLTVLLQNNKKLKFINVGDCRAVICRDNLAIQMTKDHKPHWVDEKKRIEELGGKIKKSRDDDWRICSLSVSRSFGDTDMEKYVSHKPEIFNFTLTKKDKFLIIACDGLWDAVSNQNAVHFVMEHIKEKNVALKLAEHAIKMGSYDNVSIIILFF